jgi:acyl carrier protein phosphodiesterase
MNLLAHLHLSDEQTAAVAAGNLLADYLRRLEIAPLDEEFAAGIRLHRAIDACADGDPALRAARARLTPPWRRWGGILIDVACDLFLSRHWARYSPAPLRDHVAGRLADIHRYLLPRSAPLAGLLERAIQEGWLLEYGSYDGLRRTFERMARRSPAAAALCGAEREIRRREAVLESAFLECYPRVLGRFGSQAPAGIAPPSAFPSAPDMFHSSP